ncbi:MAG: M20 family metallopeptidase [Anaerolineales bacterium]
MTNPDKTHEILTLAQQLIRIPSITVGDEERLGEVRRAANLINDYLEKAGLEVRHFDQGKYPALLFGFRGQLLAPVMLSGHFDVVAPEPDDSQFNPRIEGDYLWGRGAADMKVVVATYLVWMKDACQQGPPYPQINVLLVGNEETGEAEPMGTPHVLAQLSEECGYAPELLIAGERTEETGSGLWGAICTENRGIARFQVIFRGERGHSGQISLENDLTQRVINARMYLSDLAAQYLTLESGDSWKSQIRFPFVRIGTPGVYNVTPARGLLGVEIRVIPQDEIHSMIGAFKTYCTENDLEMVDLFVEPGVACDPGNPYLGKLRKSIRQVSGREPVIGRKIHGTSARFAPRGNGVVWGQSGLGPHAKDERHYIPSIMPYYHALDMFGRN